MFWIDAVLFFLLSLHSNTCHCGSSVIWSFRVLFFGVGAFVTATCEAHPCGVRISLRFFCCADGRGGGCRCGAVSRTVAVAVAVAGAAAAVAAVVSSSSGCGGHDGGCHHHCDLVVALVISYFLLMPCSLALTL